MVYRDEREALRLRAIAAEKEAAELRGEAEKARRLEQRVQALERELRLHRPEIDLERPHAAHTVRVMALLTLALVGVSAAWFTLQRDHATWRARSAGEGQSRDADAHDNAPGGSFTANLALSPLVLGAKRPAALISVWGECIAHDGARSSGLRAIDETTGQTTWIACNLGTAGAALHALDAGDAIAVWSRRGVVALDARTGKEFWRGKSPGSLIAACAHDGVRLAAEIEEGGVWDVDLEHGEASELAEPPAGCVLDPPREGWSSAGNDGVRMVVDASSAAEVQLLADLDVARAGPIAGGTLVLGARANRPAVALLDGSTKKWMRDLPIPAGVTPDGTTPTIALIQNSSLFVAYEPARDAGLRVASLNPATGAVVWSAPLVHADASLHAITGLALTPRSLLVHEPWHLYAVSPADGSPRFDLP